MNKTLYLTLKKPQFKVTLSGEKKIEYRRHSEWISSRLTNKKYENVKFVMVMEQINHILLLNIMGSIK